MPHSSLLLLLFLLAGCQTNESRRVDTSATKHDTLTATKPSTGTPPPPPTAAPKVYANERFNEVSVAKTSEHQYRIRGKAQVFEAAFSWVVEDGHEQLKEGHQMTDAGAPAWGNFDFTVAVAKKNPNTTLHLILFESSPKDGSRQYALSIPLE